MSTMWVVYLLAVCQANLVGPLIVAGREEEDQAEDVDIQHPVDPVKRAPEYFSVTPRSSSH